MTASRRLMRTEDLVAIATRIGRGDPQIRDAGPLESAAARHRTQVLGDDAYPDRATKAAALLEPLVRHHALVDGNTRLGWLALVLFLGLHDCPLDVDDDEADDLVIGVAEGRHDVASVVPVLRGGGMGA